MTRRVFIPVVLALAAAALLGACKATDSAGNAGGAASKSSQKSSQKPAAGGGATATETTEVHADGVRRVGPAQLQAMVEDGRVVVYDTRTKAAYDAEHIKGALSMPHDEVEARAAEFPKGKTLAFYCT